jgi:hypothetical protein
MQWALLCVTKLKLQGSALWRGPKLKIPSPCHKAETRQRDQGLNSDKEGQRGRGAEGQW